jgi:hypothetical protein
MSIHVICASHTKQLRNVCDWRGLSQCWIAEFSVEPAGPFLFLGSTQLQGWRRSNGYRLSVVEDFRRCSMVQLKSWDAVGTQVLGLCWAILVSAGDTLRILEMLLLTSSAWEGPASDFSRFVGQCSRVGLALGELSHRCEYSFVPHLPGEGC